MAVASTVNLLIALQSERRKSNGALPFVLPKPTWVVRTEFKLFFYQSNVGRKRMRKPDPPCVVCKESGRVDCHYCYGRGAGVVVAVALATTLDALELGNKGI
ncbi:hypothetical protein CXB51_017181 [Gossypium anomalum]|uniref:Uncharacterized protein n=1 Tax=Gossypium anomalum TaxID=47600 RepID=A0A8J5ZIL9_9ROSI|nr:hypothetical protein CXB51_017181 [Gossypium anomalum]